MKTNEIIAGLRKLCGQGSEYRRTVCRLAADTLEAQQKRIEELEAELKDERYRHDRYVDFELAEAKELERVKAERRWIPVTERLPEPGVRVLASDGGFVGEFYISDKGQWKRYNVNNHSLLMALDILWWMPLPEPPKEGV